MFEWNFHVSVGRRSSPSTEIIDLLANIICRFGCCDIFVNKSERIRIWSEQTYGIAWSPVSVRALPRVRIGDAVRTRAFHRVDAPRYVHKNIFDTRFLNSLYAFLYVMNFILTARTEIGPWLGSVYRLNDLAATRVL